MLPAPQLTTCSQLPSGLHALLAIPLQVKKTQGRSPGSCSYLSTWPIYASVVHTCALADQLTVAVVYSPLGFGSVDLLVVGLTTVCPRTTGRRRRRNKTRSLDPILNTDQTSLENGRAPFIALDLCLQFLYQRIFESS